MIYNLTVHYKYDPDDEHGTDHGRFREQRRNDQTAGGEQQRPRRSDDDTVPTGCLGRKRHAGPELRHVHRMDPDLPGCAGDHGVAAGIQLPETEHAAVRNAQRPEKEIHR